MAARSDGPTWGMGLFARIHSIAVYFGWGLEPIDPASCFNIARTGVAVVAVFFLVSGQASLSAVGADKIFCLIFTSEARFTFALMFTGVLFGSGCTARNAIRLEFLI